MTFEARVPTATALDPFVLVVDDDPLVLGLVVDRLEMAGYRVTSASDAWQEVIQTQGMRIGLIITDINMPGVGTGVDAFKKLRELPGTKEVPVIFMTGMKLDEARAMIPPDDRVRLLAKPIDFAELQKNIKELTGWEKSLTGE